MNRNSQIGTRGDLTVEQKEVLKELERVFKKAKRAKLSFSGMDETLLYASERCLEHYSSHIKAEVSKGEVVPAVAIVQDKVSSALENWAGEVNTSGAYKESGGW